MSTIWENIITVLVSVIPLILGKSKTAQHDSVLTGSLYCKELLGTSNQNRFLHAARMCKETFLLLVELLKGPGQLTASRFISCEEHIFILFHVLKGSSVRDTAERFQLSTDTISKSLKRTVRSMFHCSNHFYGLPKIGDPTHDYISSNPKFFPFFEDCIGAIDGTFVSASSSDRTYRDRKGNISQNVLGCIDFDMLWQFNLFGWEGSAHDGKVLTDARTKGFPHIANKYYLGDAGYALSEDVLTPYRGVRYHLKEWGRANLRPQNYKELFNLRHSSLRNIIERGFGIVKQTYPICNNMPPYSIDFQTELIQCCFMLHNFRRRHNIYEDEFDILDNVEEDVAIGMVNQVPAPALTAWRDNIANRMWVSYQAELNRRAI